MEESSKKEQGKKKITEVKIFSVPFPLGQIKENITINTNTLSNHSKDQIINQAFKLHSVGNIEEAEKYYKLFINQGFEDHRVFSNYGNILKDLGELKDAENSYRKAIEFNPNFAEAHSNLGAILIDLGNLKEAELSTLKAIELQPNFAEAHSNLAILLRKFGNLKKAELSARKAIQINDHLPDAHLNLGSILMELGNLEEAELSTLKAIQLNPNLGDCYQNLSLLLYAKGKLNLALENIKKALSIDPISKNNQLLLSVLRDKKRKEFQAISNPIDIELNRKESSSYPVILKRLVDPELINSLYKIEAIDLNKFQDPSFGGAMGSDYKLFEDNEKTTQKLKKDLTSITKGVVNSDVFFYDSFFTILSGSSIIKKHNHIVGHIDKFAGLNLWKKKYSLVYYLCVGDQDCKHPGLLKFYPDKENNNPSTEILPSDGLIVIFPADRYHSVIYDGTKDRMIIGVNFYSI